MRPGDRGRSGMWDGGLWHVVVLVTKVTCMSGEAGVDTLTARRRVGLALLPLSTGGAVVVTILVVRDSLLWPMLILVAGTGITALVVARALPPWLRTEMARRVRIGLLAGLLATAVYDLVRFVLVAALDWSVRPFEVFALFGQLLIGDADRGWQYLAGTGFHAVNGLGFPVGYLIVVLRPGVISAIVWALVLETFTILLYPSWLSISAVGEFFSISMIGHLAYGWVLGMVAVRGLRSDPLPSGSATGGSGAGGPRAEDGG